MLFGFNLNHLFVFPFQDAESRKYFFMGCLIYLAGFFIPVLPWLIAAGYNAILIRQVLNGETPHLVPWANWEKLFKDGARLFGIRLIFYSPLLFFFILFLLLSFAVPFIPTLIQEGNSQGNAIVAILVVLVSMGMPLLMMPLSLAIGLIVPAAEVHVVEKDDFMSGFQVKEWWTIFKKNWGGFVVALAIVYAVTMVMSTEMQLLIFTIVLACLFPLFLPVLSMYSVVVQYVAFAQAYKDAKAKPQRDAVVI
jgi:hypothetical protein